MTIVRMFLTFKKANSGLWLNIVPCKRLDLKFDDEQIRISIGLRLGALICVAHTCHCGKRVEPLRHATLNSVIEQTLGSLDLPSRLEPRGLYRSDGKRPDGVTMILGMGCHGCGCYNNPSST